MEPRRLVVGFAVRSFMLWLPGLPRQQALYNRESLELPAGFVV